jgi:hypothetical protein
MQFCLVGSIFQYLEPYYLYEDIWGALYKCMAMWIVLFLQYSPTGISNIPYKDTFETLYERFKPPQLSLLITAPALNVLTTFLRRRTFETLSIYVVICHWLQNLPIHTLYQSVSFIHIPLSWIGSSSFSIIQLLWSNLFNYSQVWERDSWKHEMSGCICFELYL